MTRADSHSIEQGLPHPDPSALCPHLRPQPVTPQLLQVLAPDAVDEDGTAHPETAGGRSSSGQDLHFQQRAPTFHRGRGPQRSRQVSRPAQGTRGQTVAATRPAAPMGQLLQAEPGSAFKTKLGGFPFPPFPTDSSGTILNAKGPARPCGSGEEAESTVRSRHWRAVSPPGGSILTALVS